MQTFLRRIYAFACLNHCILIYPVYAILFQESGLSSIQVTSLFMLWSAVTVVFEVPTGVLADKYKRRNILVFAQLLKGGCFLCWLASKTYFAFGVGFFLWGISSTLMSGTFESFVYDELKHCGKEESFKTVVSRIRASSFIGITIAVLLGGIIAEYGYDSALIPSSIVPFLNILVLFSIPSVAPMCSTGERAYFRILVDAFREAKNNPALLRLMIFFAITFGSMGASDELWELLFRERSFTLATIGFLFAIGNTVSALACLSVQYLPLQGKRAYAFVIIGGLASVLLALLRNPFAIVLAFVSIFILEAAFTLFQTRLQHAISSHQRATVSSINSLLLEMVAIVFYFLAGILADRFGFVSFLWLLGIITGAVSLLYLFLPSEPVAEHQTVSLAEK